MAESHEGFNTAESYVALKKELGEPDINVLIVLGTGPEKSVLFPGEVSKDQRKQWEEFKEDPLHTNEPNFYVVEGNAYRSEIQDIRNLSISRAKKRELIDAVRLKWQNNPRFTCNRWERLNVVATGDLMLSGAVKEVVFSGGTTTLPVRENALGKQFRRSKLLKEGLHSEAELMRDLLIQIYGRRLFDKDHPKEQLTEEFEALKNREQSLKYLDYDAYYESQYNRYLVEELPKKVHVETKSVNTLQNFAFTRNALPDMENAGVLSPNFQLRRALKLADLYRTPLGDKPGFDAQHSLNRFAEIRRKDAFGEMLSYLSDPYVNPDLMGRLRSDLRWLVAHTDFRYAVGFNIGYVFDIDDLSVVGEILHDMSRTGWIEYAHKVFDDVGLDFDTIEQTDLVELGKNQPEKIQEIKDALLAYKKEYKGAGGGKRENYVPPAFDTLSSSQIAFLLPQFNFGASEAK